MKRIKFFSCCCCCCCCHATTTRAFNEFLYEFLRIFLISKNSLKFANFFAEVTNCRSMAAAGSSKHCQCCLEAPLAGQRSTGHSDRAFRDTVCRCANSQLRYTACGVSPHCLRCLKNVTFSFLVLYLGVSVNYLCPLVTPHCLLQLLRGQAAWERRSRRRCRLYTTNSSSYLSYCHVTRCRMMQRGQYWCDMSRLTTKLCNSHYNQ